MQVFDDIAQPIIDQATKGFNGTIFAYGQTGSGKTYTISGEDNRNLGLIPLMNRKLFGYADGSEMLWFGVFCFAIQPQQ